MIMAEKLRTLRGNRTQEQVVQEIEEKTGEHIAISSYRLYENDQAEKPRQPSIDTLKALAKYYEVDIKCLIYDDIDITTKSNINMVEELGISNKAIENIKTIRSTEEFFKENMDETLKNDIENDGCQLKYR